MVTIDDFDGVRLITLDRPEALNAIDSALHRGIGEAFAAAVTDDDVSVILWTGSGRAFCVGQDAKEMGAYAEVGDHQDGLRPFERLSRDSAFEAYDALATCVKPVVAAVTGLAVGMGVSLLAHCDVVLAADDARFRVPFAHLGICPESAASFLLPYHLGWQAAAEWIFTGGWLSAAEAAELGLVRRVVTGRQLRDESMALARTIAEAPREALVATKSLLLASRADAVAAARHREDAALLSLFGTAKHREAMAAFAARSQRP